jgi:ATP-binding cassette, subfamily B, bacterial HlyB/CyaB
MKLSSTTHFGDAPMDAASALSALKLAASAYGVDASPERMRDAPQQQGFTLDGLVACAREAGLRARAASLDWDALTTLRGRLPLLICFKDRTVAVLKGIQDDDKLSYAVLQIASAQAEREIIIDRLRFERSWTGEAVVLGHQSQLFIEEQPFSWSFLGALILREWRLARDLVLCAVVLSFLALVPIVYYRLLADRVLGRHGLDTFMMLSIGLGVVILLETIFFYLRQRFLLIIIQRIDVRVLEYVYDQILRLPITFFERTDTGRVIHDINELARVRAFLNNQLFGSVLDALTLVVFIPFMAMFSPALTLFTLAIAGLMLLWIARTLPTHRRFASAAQSAESQRHSFLIQNLTGIRTIKSLALEGRQLALWRTYVAKAIDARFRETHLGNVIQTVVRPLERIALSGPLALGAWFAISTNDPMRIGALFAFMLLAQRVLAPLMQMTSLINQIDETRTTLDSVGRLVNQAKESQASQPGATTPIRGEIEFSGVSFTYPGSYAPALDKVSFKVPVGRSLGVVGRSGSGKTTVARLLQRLHADYTGHIRIDGRDLRDYDLTHLRKSVCVVLQDNYLFSGTIRENITMAKPDARHDEIIRAARLAGAAEFIEQLPRGYDTLLMEGAPNLSGGQRQRIAIARALLVDPSVLVLDEATSALDPESEAIVNENIGKIAEGRTVISISHRLASLVASDAILVLERGRCVDIGRHEELLARCEIYCGLWNQQNALAEENA